MRNHYRKRQIEQMSRVQQIQALFNLPVIRKDLTRGDAGQPRRIERTGSTASRAFVRVNLRCTVEGSD